LVAAEAFIIAEFKKQKWGPIAAHLDKMADGSEEWDAELCKKAFAGLQKG
jgi:hypothetical protein